jgi:hypothetical protein
VHLSKASMSVLRVGKRSALVFSVSGTKPFSEFTRAKRLLDQLCGVTEWRLHDRAGPACPGWPGWVWLLMLPIHEFLTERRKAFERWGLTFAG